MIELFCKPESVLRDLWVDACRAAQDEVVRQLADSDVFLRMNAAWYHVTSGGFVSGIHIPTLTNLPRPRLVITLIDDVYDTLVRLRRADKIFEHFDRGETMTTVLLKLLAWREVEVRLSQQIALSLDRVPFHLFPVKHPLTTFAKLLRSPPDGVTYLSHPISVVRRREQSGGPPLSEYIEEVARVLRDSDDIVLLEPTAIDEWRMDRHGGIGTVQSAELKGRWPAPKDQYGNALELLHHQLTQEENARVAQPFEGFGEDLAALTVLSSEIQKQVSWRDRMMVEQSARPIAVRPFASERGKVSEGVYDEHELHWDLQRYFTSNRIADTFPERGNRAVATVERTPPVVYHPPIDEKSRRVGAVIELITAYALNGLVADWPQEEEAESEVRSLLNESLRQADLDEWLSAPDHEIGQRVNELLRSSPGRPPHVAGSLSTSTLDISGRLRRRDETLRSLGKDVREAVKVGWARSPRHSLTPFANSHLLREEMDSATLAERALTIIANDREGKAPS
ncbi:MAG: hypothetical protein QOH36_1264 [Actinomycetota bacterium]|nr:hypothetical protein [Actinomycetota bacterium]